MKCLQGTQCSLVESEDQDCIATLRPQDDRKRQGRNRPESGEWQSYKNVTFGLQNDVSDSYSSSVSTVTGTGRKATVRFTLYVIIFLLGYISFVGSTKPPNQLLTQNV
jgi:hypothetical protein